MSKLISIIVPIYNVKPYLEKCIASILNQTYQNLQIICIDDGSTDDSGKMIDEFAKKDGRITVVHQANKGVSSARNRGLDLVQGEYFGFVDADDYIEKDMYQVLFDAIERGADIAGCAYSFDKDGTIIPTVNQRKVPEGVISARKFLRYIYQRDYYKAVGGYIYTRIYRTNQFRDNGNWKVRFDESYAHGEDALFLASCMLCANSMIYTEKYMYYYIQREGSNSHDYLSRIKEMSILKAYTIIISKFEEVNVNAYIILWIKRFYTYHASLIAEYANRVGYHDNDGNIRKEIKRYLPEYIMTNLKYPVRIYRIFKCLRVPSILKAEKSL